MAADEHVDLDLLRSSARAFLAGRGEKDSIQDLAAMDWTGLLVEDELDGAGWLPVEAVVVAEELGRAGDRSGWWGTTVAAAALASAPDDVRDALLRTVLAGDAVVATAPDGPTVRVVGGVPDALVILGSNGVHLIESAAELPDRPADDLLDVLRPARALEIDSVPRQLIGSPARATQLATVSRLLVSADSIGAVSSARHRLVDYLRERVAFGAALASFQAIQHRLVELLVFEVKARAIVMKGARAAAAGDAGAGALSVAAHAFVAARATGAVDECMQLSGGIGFTWEYPLHHELRRVFDNAQLMESPRSAHAHYAEAAGW
ncbi:acyl-CoA dehydrogenase [Mycolicibacterium sp. 120266]|uniref:acyl-CoA dehydrogenase n=1 Tax=Mycolicibacterium sp. 120266 TaxID=3090601 RepID=UPI00299DF83A|nr:acyl-CoA dehydrogenase [Mycolicibacterium sp. 120266]MDX1873869.1 acyl-CoA dehydrogenase [Mycolicibacterium sp. 120266]